MEMRKPSRAADFIAIPRPVHTLRDSEPKILADFFARVFAGFDCDEALLAADDARPAPRVPGYFRVAKAKTGERGAETA
jgi:hypothetical protein